MKLGKIKNSRNLTQDDKLIKIKYMKKILQYNVIFRPESEGGFTVIVPSLPGCVSYGKDLEKAKKMATDAIKGYIKNIKSQFLLTERTFLLL